jgi:hypothetical protein
MTSKRALTRREPGAAPALLPTFFAATVTMVAAIVAIGRIDSDWADLVAIALVLVAVGLLMAAIQRLLRDHERGSPERSGEASDQRLSTEGGHHAPS